MSICNPTLSLNGKLLGGQRLAQVDKDSLGCAFDLANLGCGLTYETGVKTPYLRLTPALQIPKNARQAVRELLFTHPDERFADLTVDPNDGEVVMRRTIRSGRFEDAEQELQDCLAFLDDVAWPALIDCIAKAPAAPEKDEDDEDDIPAALRHLLSD